MFSANNMNIYVYILNPYTHPHICEVQLCLDPKAGLRLSWNAFLLRRCRNGSRQRGGRCQLMAELAVLRWLMNPKHRQTPEINRLEVKLGSSVEACWQAETDTMKGFKIKPGRLILSYLSGLHHPQHQPHSVCNYLDLLYFCSLCFIELAEINKESIVILRWQPCANVAAVYIVVWIKDVVVCYECVFMKVSTFQFCYPQRNLRKLVGFNAGFPTSVSADFCATEAVVCVFTSRVSLDRMVTPGSQEKRALP